MYNNSPKQKRVLVITLGFYFCFLFASLFIYYLYGRQNTTETASIQTQADKTFPTRHIEPTDSVLGAFNSVTLTPTPQNNVTIKVKPTEQKEKPQIQKVPNPVSISKQEVYNLINSYRQSQGLPEITVDLRLENSSTNKARDMINNNYFEHRNPWSFINEAGYDFNYAAENLAINYYSSSSLIKGWQNSPSHNRTLLDERNQHMGFSYICDVTITQYADTCVAVIHFARTKE